MASALSIRLPCPRCEAVSDPEPSLKSHADRSLLDSEVPDHLRLALELASDSWPTARTSRNRTTWTPLGTRRVRHRRSMSEPVN